MKNNGENSGPLSSLPVNRLMATDCNATARANIQFLYLLFTFCHSMFTHIKCEYKEIIRKSYCDSEVTRDRNFERSLRVTLISLNVTSS